MRGAVLGNAGRDVVAGRVSQAAGEDQPSMKPGGQPRGPGTTSWEWGNQAGSSLLSKNL